MPHQVLSSVEGTRTPRGTPNRRSPPFSLSVFRSLLIVFPFSPKDGEAAWLMMRGEGTEVSIYRKLRGLRIEYLFLFPLYCNIDLFRVFLYVPL